MPTEARLVQGYAHKIDYRPTVATDGGQVVVIGNQVYINDRPIEANALGSLAVGNGQCIYECPIAAAAPADGTKAYWDDTANQVTATAGTNKVIGMFWAGGSTSIPAGYCRVLHAWFA